jgi:hypothetical protein
VSSLAVLWGPQAESCSFLSWSEGTALPDSLLPNLPPKCIGLRPETAVIQAYCSLRDDHTFLQFTVRNAYHLKRMFQSIFPSAGFSCCQDC